MERTAVPVGDRRYLTVMSCGIVDAAKLAAELGPAAWRDLAVDFQVAVFDIAGRFDGHYAKKLGESALVYFGYARAQEDDAERAVRAGLTLLERLAKVNERLTGEGKPRLAACIGLDAGLVTLTGEAEVLGDVPERAARVQSLAPPGSMLISGAVHNRVAGLFDVEQESAQSLGGGSGAVSLFRVMGPRKVDGRRTAGRGRTPLVGRDRELDHLSSRWDRAQAGEGQVVLVTGEPGIGKSRLVEEFRTRLAEIPHSWIEWPNSQLLQNTPFHPLSEWARQRFGGAEIPAHQRLAEVEKTLRGIGLNATEMIPLLHSVLEIPVPEQYLALAAGPSQEMRRRLFELLCQWVLSDARDRPTVLAMEDAHWADPSTIELVRVLVERGAAVPLLFLVTARPEFRASWDHRPHHSTMALGPLDPSDVLRMVTGVAAGQTTPAGLAERVVARTGGVPLFVEEIARHLLETEERGHAQQVPMTLQALLMARLDRLGPAREVAQIAAVLGFEFRLPLLQAIAAMEEAELVGLLDRLVEADLFQALGSGPVATYRFKHALIQDAAYESLLEARRRELHRAAAQALAERFSDAADRRAELLAHHLTRAGETEAAIAAWEAAATEATARGAFAEVTVGIRRAIDILLTLPNASSRTSKEFQLRTRLAECYWAAKGQSADETVAVFKEALEVGRHVDEPRAMATLLSGLVSASNQRAEFDTARALGERLLALARDGGPFARGWATFRRGQTSIYLGELAEARRLYDEALRLGDGEDRLVAGGVELVGAVTVFSPWLSALMGEIDRARDEAANRLRAAEKAGGPHNRAHVRLGSVLLYQSLGDAMRVEEHARTLLADGEKFRMPIFVAYATLSLGWAAGRLGRPAEAAELLTSGIAMLAATGTTTNMNVYRARLAQATADAGGLDLALAVIDHAESLRSTSPLQEPEVLKIKGLLLRRRALAGDDDAAETAFLRAQEITRRMGNRLYELEVSIALARLMLDRGQRDAGRMLLAEAYGQLGQGLDTPVPNEAREVLARIDGDAHAK